MRVEALTDPAAFLRAADAVLTADPVAGTVPATVAQRFVDHPGAQGPDDWFAVVRDDAGDVVAAAMRTAPYAPRCAYLLAMPDAAARALAAWTRERAEVVGGLNGDPAAVAAFADELGAGVRTVERTRLWEVHEVLAPPVVPGRLRAATRDDLGLATAWYAAFGRAAAEQAGHDPVHVGEPTEADMLRRVESGTTWLWEDDTGRPVHLTGLNPPSLGVARLGPVYTPPGERGRGWAAAAVAQLSTRVLAAGDRACLFTDRANPVSTALYARLGYRPVGDTVEVRLDALERVDGPGRP